jgi:1-acyl-sn-glycerol-3-phosphate acyltransferase
LPDAPQSVISPCVTEGAADFSGSEKDLSFRLLKSIGGFYARAYYHTKIVRPCNLPPKGPAILVSNHTSSIDPVFLQAFCPRLVRWMMAKEYFKYKAMRWMFDTVGVILVERSGRDMAATRAAIRALESGYVLGVFPEGKIEPTRELLPFQSGIGLLALKTGAPVYPAYLDGAQRNSGMIEAALRPGDASIAYGPPVDLHKADGVKEATARIQAAVENLRVTNSKTLSYADQKSSAPEDPTAASAAR